MAVIPQALGIHWQGAVPGWANALSNAEFQKVIDPGPLDPFPGRKTIGRAYVPDNISNLYVAAGAQGAEAFYQYCRPIYERAPWVWCWEAANEPGVATPAQRAALVAFTRRWVDLMHAAGRKTVALCLSVGWPDVGCAPALAGALETTDYWAVHEYGAPTMQSQETWLCLRYRRTVTELLAAGARVPPLLITECGLDGGVCGQPKKSWKTFTDVADYLEQLAWYVSETRRDAYVHGLTVFTGAPNSDWLDFEVTEPLLQGIAQINQGLANLPPPVVPPPTEAPMEILFKNPTTHQYEPKDWAWVTRIFGQGLRVLDAGNVKKFKLTKIVFSADAAVVNLLTYNADGAPHYHEYVGFSWPKPEAPDPALQNLAGGGLKSLWSTRADVKMIPDAGDPQQGFGISQNGWYYTPPDTGPGTAWVLSPSLPSDGLTGIGMVLGSEYGDCHVMPTHLYFTITEPSGEPPVEPPPTDPTQLDRIEAKVDAILALLGAPPEPPVSKPAIVDLVGTLPHQTPDYALRDTALIDRLVVHHTAGNPAATPEAIAAWIIKPVSQGGKDYPGFPYHYLVMPDGTLYQCQAHAAQTYHVGDDNAHCLGIALNGTYTTTTPPAAQLAATKALLGWLRATLHLPASAIVGHRELSPDPQNPTTVCPGNTYLGGWREAVVS